jgi:hypothetical protein
MIIIGLNSPYAKILALPLFDWHVFHNLHSFVDEGVFCIINISFFCITLIKISVI